MKKSKYKNRLLRSWTENRSTYIASFICVIVLLVMILTVWWPTIKYVVLYPVYYVKCGFNQPIIADGHDYAMPGDAGYKISLFTQKYFCSEDEAQSAGYYRAATIE